jgi:hypothetical protein
MSKERDKPEKPEEKTVESAPPRRRSTNDRAVNTELDTPASVEREEDPVPGGTKWWLLKSLEKERQSKDKLVEKLVEKLDRDDERESNDRWRTMKIVVVVIVVAMMLAAGAYGVFSSIEYTPEGELKFNVGGKSEE